MDSHYHKIWRCNHRESVRRSKKKYYLEHPEKKKAGDAAHYKKVCERRDDSRAVVIQNWILAGGLTKWISLFWVRAFRERAFQQARSVRWYGNNKSKAFDSAYAWNKKNRKLRYHTNPSFRLASTCRTRVHHALKGVGVKSSKTFALIGCSVEELKTHLEKKFTPGMSWHNYGAWHVDHILACTNFDLSLPEEQAKCFNWRNLQPLWAADNFRKGNR
jgi:hypothetical protein